MPKQRRLRFSSIADHSLLLLLLGSALNIITNAAANAINPCLDHLSEHFRCRAIPPGICDLQSCGLTDDDAEDMSACFDVFGRDNILTVSLEANRLESLQEWTFSGMEHLQTLELEGNRLTALSSNIFSDLQSLTFIDLSDNNLASLPETVFAGLESLEFLWLPSNRLTTFPEGLFLDLRNLIFLQLGGNMLASLPECAFTGLSSLKTLYLANNDLTSLPEGIFQGLRSLEDLWLVNNKLTTLPRGLFSDAESLSAVWLLGNDDLQSVPVIPVRSHDVVYLNAANESGGRVTCGGANDATSPSWDLRSKKITPLRLSS